MSRKEIFGELRGNLKLVGEKLKDDRNSRPDKEVTLEEFWPQFERQVNAVSSECTKLCLAFSSKPVPSSAECNTFRDRVEGVILKLVSMVYSLPGSQGIRLRNRVFDTTASIVFSVHSLVHVICEHAEAEHDTALQCTGGVWELCDGVSNLPRNNKQVTVQLIKQSLNLVKDAVEEIEEELKKEDDDDLEQEQGNSWSEEDKKVVSSSIGIIKVAKSMWKKLQESIKNNGHCDSAAAVSELDTICSKVDNISPVVDDVIEALYPPMSRDVVYKQLNVLLEAIQTVLSECPSWHMVTESDQAWVDFLLKAADHNWTKLNALDNP